MRNRMIQCKLFTHFPAIAVSPEAKWFLVGLMTEANDSNGCVTLDLDWLRNNIGVTATQTYEELQTWTDELVRGGFIAPYEVEGRPYARVLGWNERNSLAYQSIKRQFKDKYPSPDSDVNKGENDAVRDYDEVRSGSGLGGRSTSERKRRLPRPRSRVRPGPDHWGAHDKRGDEGDNQEPIEPTTQLHHPVATMSPKSKRRKASSEMKKLLAMRKKETEGKELVTKARASVGLQKRAELPNKPGPRLTKGGPVKAAQRGSEALQIDYEGMTNDQLLDLIDNEGWSRLMKAKDAGKFDGERYRALAAIRFKRMSS